jgi:hypothetical protein
MPETAPWIDPQELDSLCKQYPELSRALVSLALEAYWPVKADVEAALQGLMQSQGARPEGESLDSLDFTGSVVAGEPAALRNG